jgi:hypothetical protein
VNDGHLPPPVLWLSFDNEEIAVDHGITLISERKRVCPGISDITSKFDLHVRPIGQFDGLASGDCALRTDLERGRCQSPQPQGPRCARRSFNETTRLERLQVIVHVGLAAQTSSLPDLVVGRG